MFSMRLGIEHDILVLLVHVMLAQGFAPMIFFLCHLHLGMRRVWGCQRLCPNVCINFVRTDCTSQRALLSRHMSREEFCALTEWEMSFGSYSLFFATEIV